MNLGISDSQLQSLLQGHKIFVEKSQFQGDVALPLTQKQANTIATSSRGVNLKFSSRQISALQRGEGFFQDVAAKLKTYARKGVPYARQGIDAGLDMAQAQIPTEKLGIFKPAGDRLVQEGRKLTGKLLDRIQAFFGGAAGRMAIDAKMGAGWFDEYLLPGLQTAANIALPLVRGRGNNKPANIRKAIDQVKGEGWFSDYLLPGLETAAQIVTPILRGRGFEEYSGQGWFTDVLLPNIDTVAKLAPLLRGGGKWESMTQKKPTVKAWGLVL